MSDPTEKESTSTPLTTEPAMQTEEQQAQQAKVSLQNETKKMKEEEAEVNAFPTAATSWISAGTSWGSSWLNSAKQKTMNTLDLVKKDLSEFTEVMSQEVNEFTTAAKGGLDSATSVVKQQAQYLEKLVTPDDEQKDINTPAEKSIECEEYENKVEKSSSMSFGWMKSLVDTVTDTVKSLATEDTTKGEELITETIRPKVARFTTISPLKLSEIQTTESTYLTESENKEVFDQWNKRFTIEEHDGEINMLLSNNPPMRQIYSKLVPSIISSEVFWTRYFYAVKVAEMDEEMKQSFSLNQLSIKTTDKDNRKNKKNVSESPKNDPDSPSSDGSSLAVLEEPTSPAKSTDDWSVCSEKNDVEELNSTQGDEHEEMEEAGPLTPRASGVDNKGSNERKEDGWVDWDE